MLAYGKKVNKYFAKHPAENALAHMCVGLGFGFLLTYPLAGSHPLRWAMTFLVIGLVMHIRAIKS